MFIKVPFLIEGILQGLLGSFFSVTVLWILYSLAQYIFVPIFNPMSIDILNILYANIFIGIVLGIIGSYRGFSKYI